MFYSKLWLKIISEHRKINYDPLTDIYHVANKNVSCVVEGGVFESKRQQVIAFVSLKLWLKIISEHNYYYVK